MPKLGYLAEIRKTLLTGNRQLRIETAEDHALIAYVVELDYDGEAMQCACTSTWVKEAVTGAAPCTRKPVIEIDDSIEPLLKDLFPQNFLWLSHN